MDRTDQRRQFQERPDHGRELRPEPMPKTATASAIGSSKWFGDAVEASVAV